MVLFSEGGRVVGFLFFVFFWDGGSRIYSFFFVLEVRIFFLLKCLFLVNRIVKEENFIGSRR